MYFYYNWLQGPTIRTTSFVKLYPSVVNIPTSMCTPNKNTTSYHETVHNEIYDRSCKKQNEQKKKKTSTTVTITTISTTNKHKNWTGLQFVWGTRRKWTGLQFVRETERKWTGLQFVRGTRQKWTGLQFVRETRWKWTGLQFVWGINKFQTERLWLRAQAWGATVVLSSSCHHIYLIVNTMSPHIDILSSPSITNKFLFWNIIILILDYVNKNNIHN